MPNSDPPGPPPMRRSLLIYLALMGYLVGVKVILSVASVAFVVLAQEELFRWEVISGFTLIGGLGVWLQPRVGIPALWDDRISTRKRLVLPALVGLGLGAISLTLQGITGAAHVLAEAANVPSINVSFPASIPFYSGGAIILESMYRLILITLPLWLIANVILRKRGQTQVFWILALVISAHEPYEQASFFTAHTTMMVVSAVTTYAINIFEAILLKRYGFLAPLSFRVGYYAVLHMVGSALGF